MYEHSLPTAPSFAGMYGGTVDLSDGTTRVVDDDFIRWVMWRDPNDPHDIRYPKAKGHDFRCKFPEWKIELLLEGLKEFSAADGY